MNILQKENIQITSLYLKTVVGNLYKVVVDAASIIFNKQSKLQAQKFFLIPNRKKAFYSRYQNYAYSYFGLFLTLFFIHYQVGLQNGYTLWNPKSWYLTPGLWERTGTSFWFGFLFETPFALFRSGIIPLFFLAWSIYFLHIAEKGKKEAKKLEKY